MFGANRGEENVPRSVPTNAEVITLGVDTHKDIHVAVALDGLGRCLGTLSVPTIPAGYESVPGWRARDPSVPGLPAS